MFKTWIKLLKKNLKTLKMRENVENCFEILGESLRILQNPSGSRKNPSKIPKNCNKLFKYPEKFLENEEEYGKLLQKSLTIF